MQGRPKNPSLAGKIGQMGISFAGGGGGRSSPLTPPPPRRLFEANLGGKSGFFVPCVCLRLVSPARLRHLGLPYTPKVVQGTSRRRD